MDAEEEELVSDCESPSPRDKESNNQDGGSSHHSVYRNGEVDDSE